MPKPRRQAASISKIKQCLQALVTDPEAACMGGNEMCCAGCGGNSDLVDSLCAFCLHSDAARRYFVSNGGLDALLLAGRNSQSEKTTLAALQVLQCLCSTQLGQQLVVTQKPELLQMVCDQALDQDEDREGLQHAALTILTGWAADGPESQLLSWFTHYPAIKQQTSQQFQQQLPGHSLVFGAGTLQPFPLSTAEPALVPSTSNCMSISEPAMLHIASRALQHPTLAVRRAAAQLFAAACAASSSDAGATAAAVSRADSLALQVQQLLRTEQESVGVPRFAAYANGRSQLMLDPLAFLRHQEHMQDQKQACHALMHMSSELAASGACGAVLGQATRCLPALLAIFESAWQVGAAKLKQKPGSGLLPMDVPFSFLQDHQSRELALDTLVVVLRQPGMLARLGQALRDEDANQSGRDNEVTCSRHVLAAAAKEKLQGSHQQGVDDEQAQCSVEQAAEQRALRRLLQLVHSLLRQQSAGHVRAALTLVGHVRFDHAPGDDASRLGPHSQWLQQLCDLFDAIWVTEMGHAQDEGYQPPPTADPTSQPATAAEPAAQPQPQVVALPMASPEPSAGSQPAAAGVDRAAWWPGSSADVEPQWGRPAGDQGPGRAVEEEDYDPRAVFSLDVGLGYRVLVQTLQSWKSLLDSGAASVLRELDNSGYLQRVSQAMTHPKPMMVAAAHKVLHHGTPAGQATDVQAQQVGITDAATWADWGAWNGLDGLQGNMPLDAVDLTDMAPLGAHDDSFMAAAAAAMGFDLGAQGPGGAGSAEDDEDMQEFLSVLLEGAPADTDGQGGPPSAHTDAAPTLTSVPEDTEGPDAGGLPDGHATTERPLGMPGDAGSHLQGKRVGGQAQDGLFSAWDEAQGPEDDMILAEALLLLPDLDNVAQNMCVKYDGPPVSRRPGAAMASPLSMLML